MKRGDLQSLKITGVGFCDVMWIWQEVRLEAFVRSKRLQDRPMSGVRSRIYNSRCGDSIETKVDV